jgi:TubC N-terminal docking domain
MSAAHSILTEITRRGIAVRVDGETLRFKPRLALDDDLVERIKEHKAEIIRAVVTEGSDQIFHSSTESLAAERRFGQSHAKLFPFLGRKVRTPKGSGTLIQVFAERVTVLLDSERDKCSFFNPTQIEPVSVE